MINHLIRQEKKGGYWFIRNEGRAIELTQPQYDLMTQWYERHGNIDISGSGKDTKLFSQMQQYGLLENPNWQEIKHVASDVPLQQLSDIASIAPKRIYFEITRYCNLACRSCFNNSRHKLSNELTKEEIIDINRQAEEMGVFEIRYTGGECTRIPGFVDIVKDAKARGIYISIGTNGVYTHEQLEWLPESGIDWFIISLDGDRETNDKVRGRGSFQSVVETLKHLSTFPHLRLRLNMVVAKHNVAKIENVAKIAAKFNVAGLNLIPLRPYGRSTIRMTKDMFNQHDFFEFIHEVNRLRQQFPEVTFSTTIDLLDPDEVTSHDLIVQKKKTCAAGVEGVVIGPQGHVYGCSYSPASFPDTAGKEENIFIAGNIRKESLKTIWRDDSRWQVFRNLALYKNEKCHSCNHYTKRCSGSCQIMSYYQMQHKKTVTNNKGLGEFLDPYCFKDIFDKQGKGKISDMTSPCGGAGMDGF